MTVSSSALSLLEWANLSNSPLVKSVTYSLRKAGSIMTDVPFVNSSTLLQNGVRFTGGLPIIDWVPLNTEPTTVKSTGQPYQEQAYTFRNNVDVDKLLVMDQNQIVSQRGFQTEAVVRSFAYDFNDKFINNDHVAGDSDAFVGVKYRLDNPTIYGTLSGNKIDTGGSVASLKPASLTATTYSKFMEKLDEMFWALNSPDGDGVVIYANDTVLRRINTGARLASGQGGFSTAQDQYGRTVTTYRNAVLRDVGVKADQTTRIILNTETSTGAAGSSTFTSLYGVRYGMDGLFGWQFYPLNVQDLGLLNNGVIYRTLIDWTGGVMMPDIRAIARLYDVEIA
jgi:hypothetical protein